jgi:CRP-like cAMP-binding protein
MAEDVEIVLRKTPLFASLTETEMRALAARVSKRHFQRGELLFGEGDPCTGLFLVASGKIRIFKLSAAGREQVLAVEGFQASRIRHLRAARMSGYWAGCDHTAKLQRNVRFVAFSRRRALIFQQFKQVSMRVGPRSNVAFQVEAW